MLFNSAFFCKLAVFEKAFATFGFSRTFSSSKARTSPILFPLAANIDQHARQINSTK